VLPPGPVPLGQFWDFADKYGISSDDLTSRVRRGP
jgi:hypothetical protein